MNGSCHERDISHTYDGIPGNTNQIVETLALGVGCAHKYMRKGTLLRWTYISVHECMCKCMHARMNTTAQSVTSRSSLMQS